MVRANMAAMHDITFEHLMAGLQAKDPSAATRVFQQFAERLIYLARSRLNPRLRGKVDPEDIVQSALKSFFCRQEAGQFQLNGWGELSGLLVTITMRKCGRRAEEFYAACRDVRREQRPVPHADGSCSDADVPALDPTPYEATVLRETIEWLMCRLDPTSQQILLLRLRGHSATEIGAQVGRTVRTVRRNLEYFKQRLERYGAAV